MSNNEMLAGQQMTKRKSWFNRLIKRLYSPLKWARQKLCGFIFNHRPLHPTDRGWLIGSKMCDRWCARCGKMVTIPMSEDTHYDDPNSQSPTA